jgi:alpha-soluble NSF attachment protein
MIRYDREAAGDTYARAGEICEKNIKDENEASTNYVNAAKAYKNSNASKAMKYFQISTNMLMEHNRFSSAAKLWKEVAELYEKDLQYRYASEAYEKAATCYEAEDSKANASACKIKVAQLAAELEDYKKSIEIYEQVSRQALDTNVGRWSVTKYLFAALLCQFALSAKKGDLSRLENKLEKYRDMHPQLDGTREARLIENCIQAFNEDDVDKYTDEVMRYDEILKLDNWTAKILLDIKTSLQEGAEGEKDAGDVSDLQ